MYHGTVSYDEMLGESIYNTDDGKSHEALQHLRQVRRCLYIYQFLNKRPLSEL